jgi:S1-C subfamily serine protease
VPEQAAVAVYQRVAPSVVLVTSRGVRPTPLGPQPATDFGTGVIFDPRGFIVTNEHVVAGGQRLEVTLDDGRSFTASLVGADPSTDLAVLRIDAGRPLPAAVFADGPVRPGELAIAIGNPLGPRLHQSVTVGVVSAVRPMLYGLLRSDPRVTRMIQTDVAINPGNSGGPLLNAAGEVIGITTVKLPLVEPGIAAAGLGFAIPAGTVRRVVSDLVRYGYVRRAWLGLRLAASPAEALPGERQRLAVAGVVAGSPAARAGLRPGDDIVAWDGVPVRNDVELVAAIDAARPGKPVRLTVRRGSALATLVVVPGVTPPPAQGLAVRTPWAG